MGSRTGTGNSYMSLVLSLHVHVPEPFHDQMQKMQKYKYHRPLVSFRQCIEERHVHANALITCSMLMLDESLLPPRGTCSHHHHHHHFAFFSICLSGLFFIFFLSQLQRHLTCRIDRLIVHE